MITSYKQIHGWFNYESVYDEVVLNAKDGDVFVEIGAWQGKSTAYLAQLIKNSGKKIFLNVVDTWKGTPDEQIHSVIVSQYGGDIFPVFQSNMEQLGLIDYITPIQSSSEEASKLFSGNSCDFVFIDAGHLYEDIKNDIKCWLPKVKDGGILAGHDYPTSKGVVKAVDERFPQCEKKSSCWIQKIKYF
jgi:hypothetical protein